MTSMMTIDKVFFVINRNISEFKQINANKKQFIVKITFYSAWLNNLNK